MRPDGHANGKHNVNCTQHCREEIKMSSFLNDMIFYKNAFQYYEYRPLSGCLGGGGGDGICLAECLPREGEGVSAQGMSAWGCLSRG